MSPPNTCWPLDQKVFYWGACLFMVTVLSFFLGVIPNWNKIVNPGKTLYVPTGKTSSTRVQGAYMQYNICLVYRYIHSCMYMMCIWCICSCNCPVDFLEESSQMVALRTHALHQWCLIMHHGCPSHVLSSIFMYILYMVYTVYTVYTVYLIHNPTLAVLQGLPAFAIFMDQT